MPTGAAKSMVDEALGGSSARACNGQQFVGELLEQIGGLKTAVGREGRGGPEFVLVKISFDRNHGIAIRLEAISRETTKRGGGNAEQRSDFE